MALTSHRLFRQQAVRQAARRFSQIGKSGWRLKRAPGRLNTEHFCRDERCEIPDLVFGETDLPHVMHLPIDRLRADSHDPFLLVPQRADTPAMQILSADSIAVSAILHRN